MKSGHRCKLCGEMVHAREALSHLRDRHDIQTAGIPAWARPNLQYQYFTEVDDGEEPVGAFTPETEYKHRCNVAEAILVSAEIGEGVYANDLRSAIQAALEALQGNLEEAQKITNLMRDQTGGVR